MAVAAGADMLVAQGHEAGGHTGQLSLLSFLSRVVSAYPDLPVLASGGIGDGRTLAAALAAGAEGAWAGTAFLASPETVEVVEIYKQRVIESDGTDTVFSRVYDIVDGLPWPEGIGGRVYCNRFVDEWEGRDDELVARQEELRAVLNEAYQRDTDVAAVYMGQSAAFVNGARPAGEVVRSICDDAERILRERAEKLLN
jgi:nitronate monooxygenase